MRLLILGASGGCGQWLMRLAAERNHDVTALVRPTATIGALPGVRMLHGDVLDPAILNGALGGCDAVASCLGLRRAGRSPWAPLLSPPDLTSRVGEALVPAMQRSTTPRLVAISAGGVGGSATRLTGPVRWLVTQGSIAVAYRDLARMEAVLSRSSLDWLAVRPVTLTDGSPTGRVGPVARYGLLSTVRRADVATWMLAALEQRAPFVDHAVMLGST